MESSGSLSWPIPEKFPSVQRVDVAGHGFSEMGEVEIMAAATLTVSPAIPAWLHQFGRADQATKQKNKEWDTLWLFNIAMENGPFIDGFPIETSIYEGLSMAMLNNQIKNGIWMNIMEWDMLMTKNKNDMTMICSYNMYSVPKMET